MGKPNVSNINVDNGDGKRFGAFFISAAFCARAHLIFAQNAVERKTSQFFPFPLSLLSFSTFSVHMSFRVPTSCSVVTTAVQNPESSSSYKDNQRNGNMDCEKYQKKFVNKDSFNDNR